MTGPDDNDLRDASLARLAASITTPFLARLDEAVCAHDYSVQAYNLGVSYEESQRVLREVIAELSATGSDGDAFAIAQHRLAEGPGFRPPEELREAARQMLAAGGYSLHPEHVDAHAWSLQRVAAAYAPRPPWYKRWWRRIRNILRRKTA